MKLRGIKIKKLKKILETIDGNLDEILIGIPLRTTLLVFDNRGNHFGSIYLKEEIER